MLDKPIKRIRWRQKWYQVYCGCDDTNKAIRASYQKRTQTFRDNCYKFNRPYKHSLKIIHVECSVCGWYHYLTPEVPSTDTIYANGGSIYPHHLIRLENIKTTGYYGLGRTHHDLVNLPF